MRKCIYVNLIGLLIIAVFIQYNIVSTQAIKAFIIGLFGLNAGFLIKIKNHEKNK